MSDILSAVLQAVEDKKAHDVVVLDISEVSSFTDFFILCTGTSSRQNQAIADAVDEKARVAGTSPAHVEGYQNAEWILMDFIDFVVHVFSPTSRAFYDLERLWQDGKRIEPASLLARMKTVRQTSGHKTRSRGTAKPHA